MYIPSTYYLQCLFHTVCDKAAHPLKAQSSLFKKLWKSEGKLQLLNNFQTHLYPLVSLDTALHNMGTCKFLINTNSCTLVYL